jgi:hypothetical protein
MKVSYISLIAVMLVVIAVAIAGCSGSTPATPSTSTPTQAPGSSAAPTPSGTSAVAVGGADLFGGLNYNWVEYKMSAGSGDQAMTIYTKYNKQTGKCSMRFEGAGAAQMPASMQNIDCSSQGNTQASNDPNEVNPDAKIDCSPLEETVTVPAGTFSATKCTVTAKEGTSTTWVAKGKFMVRMEGKANDGSGTVNMVLNSYG